MTLLGKPVGNDARNDKATYVTIFSWTKPGAHGPRSGRQGRPGPGTVRAAGRWFLKELVEHLLVRGDVNVRGVLQVCSIKKD